MAMQNLWSDADARAMVADYAAKGVNEDLASCVYATRLLGSEPRLVLHGGGNSSVKTRLPDMMGDPVDVLCVKGSGWDMGAIEPQGLPAVRLAPLQRLAELDALSDEDMVNAQRLNLLDATSPNPSVETLLHAFLPHKHVHHTHANPVLALSDQPNGAKLCADLYGERAALVPYQMPGFALAKAAKQVFEGQPDCEGMILLQHGLFAFGDTAQQAYDRMIELADLADDYIATRNRRPVQVAALPTQPALAADIAPILRGACAIVEDAAQRRYKRWVLTWRNGPAVMDYVNRADLADVAPRGVVTPDHAIRTKPQPLVLPAPAADGLATFQAAAQQAIADYARDYGAYFARNNARFDGGKTALDPVPRVLLVPGVGLFAVGETPKNAAITADIAENCIDVVTLAEAIGKFESLSDPDHFDIEYWSLEQAKLGKRSEPALARHVVAVTGGAGTIGAATARAFAAEGAVVAALDLDAGAADAVAKPLGGVGFACDVCDPASVRAAFARLAETFGGVDIVVSNAGNVWQGPIGEVADKALRASFELNFFAHQTVAQAAVAVMRAQGTGGALLFNASKAAVEPGRNLGPYGAAKAATLYLARQYAVDHGAEGIRAATVNADRVRSNLVTDEMIAMRAKARGITEAEYMAGNLLHLEVTAADVADAFVALAKARKTSGGFLTVDGGNTAGWAR
jgi:rhamnose utilization protein RhaD (predicted bifunctional aldolase and dehydrogenase)/NAD(P)-dependent dehydrogenase (short-subunit alcohol dehydrogenase family)